MCNWNLLSIEKCLHMLSRSMKLFGKITFTLPIVDTKKKNWNWKFVTILGSLFEIVLDFHKLEMVFWLFGFPPQYIDRCKLITQISNETTACATFNRHKINRKENKWSKSKNKWEIFDWNPYVLQWTRHFNHIIFIRIKYNPLPESVPASWFMPRSNRQVFNVMFSTICISTLWSIQTWFVHCRTAVIN